MSRYIPESSHGIPAHITILWPFAPLELITDGVLKELESIFSPIEPFQILLEHVSRFPQTTFLRPEPAQPFIDLTMAVESRFPEYPPFGGTYTEITPHLTVAHGSTESAEEAERELNTIVERLGPIRAVCSKVDLYEDSTGKWRQHTSFDFQGNGRRYSL